MYKFGMIESPDIVKKKRKLNKNNIFTNMHFYNRHLEPIRENFKSDISDQTPYNLNFETLNGSRDIMSHDFKSSLLKNMGENVKCMTSNKDLNKGSKITTYTNTTHTNDAPKINFKSY